VLWHFLAGLAVYFGSLSDAQVRATAVVWNFWVVWHPEIHIYPEMVGG
jgi:hypothetical protein